MDGLTACPTRTVRGAFSSMIDTDFSRWRRSVRRTSTVPVRALLAVGVAAALGGCAGSAGTSPSAARTPRLRSSSGRPAAPAPPTPTSPRRTDRSSPVLQTDGRRGRQAPGRGTLGPRRWRARARNHRHSHAVRVGDLGPGRQAHGRVAGGDQRARRERASGLDSRVGNLAGRRRLADLRQHRPPADHRPVRQSGRPTHDGPRPASPARRLRPAASRSPTG